MLSELCLEVSAEQFSDLVVVLPLKQFQMLDDTHRGGNALILEDVHQCVTLIIEGLTAPVWIESESLGIGRAAG